MDLLEWMDEWARPEWADSLGMALAKALAALLAALLAW